MAIEQQPAAGAPEDYAAYESWRKSGEQAAGAEETSSSEAPAETQDAETPNPEPEPESKDQEQEEGEEKPSKGKGGFQRKIDRLTREKYEREARIEALERQLAERSAGKAAEPETKQTPAGKPDADSFTSYDEYLVALTDWRVAVREAQREERDAKVRAETEQREKAVTWRQRVDSFASEHADFHDVVSDSDVEISVVLQEAIATSEHGPAVAYHLARHPEEARRITALSPVAQVRELGKLEARFEKAPETPKTRATQAPKPPTPVSGAAKAAPRIDGDIPYEVYEQLRKAQERRG